jgi:hypothetical protein
VLARVDTTGLAPGTHAGAILVRAPGADNSPRTIPVNLTLSQFAFGVCPRPPIPMSRPNQGKNPTTKPAASPIASTASRVKFLSSPPVGTTPPATVVKPIKNPTITLKA